MPYVRLLQGSALSHNTDNTKSKSISGQNTRTTRDTLLTQWRQGVTCPSNVINQTTKLQTKNREQLEIELVYNPRCRIRFLDLEQESFDLLLQVFPLSLLVGPPCPGRFWTGVRAMVHEYHMCIYIYIIDTERERERDRPPNGYKNRSPENNILETVFHLFGGYCTSYLPNNSTSCQISRAVF